MTIIHTSLDDVH